MKVHVVSSVSHTQLGSLPKGEHDTKDIAQATGISVGTVDKIMQTLIKAGMAMTIVAMKKQEKSVEAAAEAQEKKQAHQKLVLDTKEKIRSLKIEGNALLSDIATAEISESQVKSQLSQDRDNEDLKTQLYDVDEKLTDLREKEKTNQTALEAAEAKLKELQPPAPETATADNTTAEEG